MSTSIVLVCAILASLAAGVLVAYGVCAVLFSMFRAHARQVRGQNPVPVAVRVPQV